MNSDDLVLKSFLATAKNKGGNLSDEILIEIYNIEKKHQFTDGENRSGPFREIEKAIQTYIEKQGG